MRGILVTLLSVTALVSAGTVNKPRYNKDPSQASVICSDPESDGVLVAHEICNKFYKCAHGTPVALRCAAHTLYNPEVEHCDWPEDVDCGNRIIVEFDDDKGNDESEEDKEHSVNDDPSQAPTICAEDDSDSVLVAHELCNQFYICLHGNPFPLKCPSGLLFDPKTRACEWPYDVECGDRIIPEETVDTHHAYVEDEKEINNDPSKAPEICAKNENVLVAHEYCNYFYHCAGGRPIARRCPRGLVYNYNTELCDWLENVECGNRVIVENDEDDEKEPEDVSEEDLEGHDDPSKAPAICAEEDSDGVLVAHEICNRFYICASGVPVARRCPKGLLYNPKREACDWPESVTCGDRAPPADDDEDSSENNDGEDQDDDDDYEGNYDPTKAQEICAQEDSDGVLIAHEECNKFYICLKNEPLAMFCPENLLFNPRRNACDWPDNVNCWSRKHIAPASVQLKSRIEVTGFSYSGIARQICSEEDSEGKLLGHQYCNKFYQCVGELAVELKCPNGLHFTIEDQHCEWPENVDCGDRIIPEKTEDDEDKDENDEEEPIGNNFDDPSKAPEICAQENSDGKLIAHEYCNKFYICVGYVPLARECPENLWFNPKIDRCDWQYNVQCDGRLIH